MSRIVTEAELAEVRDDDANQHKDGKHPRQSLTWDTDTIDEKSTLGDNTLSMEDLQMIKARTMFNMVEEISSSTSADATRRILFLTNAQADMLAGSATSINKMLSALEIPKPQLIINLLMSHGFSSFTKCVEKSDIEDGLTNFYAGTVHGRGPFLTQQDEVSAQETIDRFMADVIIPLAARTNAVILCCANPCDCILASSLTRMFSIVRAKWSGAPPFSILSCTPNVKSMYCNPSLRAEWREVKRSCNAWRQRDKLITDLTHAAYDGRSLPYRAHDLDPNAMIYLLVDTINPKKGNIGDRRAYNRLMNELVRELASTLPSLAIKTGNSCRCTLETSVQAAESLGVAIQAMVSGTPLLFLDVRPRIYEQSAGEDQEQRGAATAKDRSELITVCKEQYAESCDLLLKSGVAETFDTMAIAYFHDVLFGDGNMLTTERPHAGLSRQQHMALHAALALAEAGRDSKGSGDRSFAPASAKQVQDCANWLAARLFEDAWALLPDREAREKQGETAAGLYADYISAFALQARTLLSSPSFHHLNLADSDGAARLVAELVRLDRIPRSNSVEGLRLLREAWCEYDVAVYLARRYKVISKLIFALQLVLGWFVVFFSVPNAELLAVSEVEPPVFKETAFTLTVLAGGLLSLESLLNAQLRWRQLRTFSGLLESKIWQYRARVGAFEMDLTNPDSMRPEQTLCETLSHWREDLVASAQLQTSSLEKKYPQSIYRHLQFEGELHKGEDDFQSPVRPSQYIEQRLQPKLKFYRGRLPRYTRQRYMLKTTLLLCIIAASILTRYGQLSVVVLITAFSSSVTTWMEFSDHGHKIERYTRAVRSLKNLLLWWCSLSEVKRASTAIISELILRGEAIIADERVAWESSAIRHTGGDSNGDMPQFAPTTGASASNSKARATPAPEASHVASRPGFARSATRSSMDLLD